MRYIEIYNELKSNILNGKYPSNSKLPFVTELMKLFAAGRCTIQHSLKLLEKEGLTKGVPSQGTFVKGNDKINLFTSNNNTSRIAILHNGNFILKMQHPYFRQMSTASALVFEKLKITPYLINTHNKTFTEIIREIDLLQINSILAIEINDKNLILGINKLKIKLVFMDILDFDFKNKMIVGNNIQGGQLVTRSLINRGHKNILYIDVINNSAKKEDPMSTLRFKGILAESKTTLKTKVTNEKIKFKNLNKNKLLKTIKNHNNCKAIIVSGYNLFVLLKEVLQDLPIKEFNKYDIIVFESNTKSEIFRNKKIQFCSWDAKLMGKIGAKSLINDNFSKEKIIYLPMFLSK